MYIQTVPGFLGRMKLPVKVAPAWSSITSPGWEAWRAAWRSPPAFTRMSLPRVGGEYVVSRKTRGNSGSVWAKARAGSSTVVATHAKMTARRARRAGEPVPENMLVSNIGPGSVGVHQARQISLDHLPRSSSRLPRGQGMADFTRRDFGQAL